MSAAVTAESISRHRASGTVRPQRPRRILQALATAVLVLAAAGFVLLAIGPHIMGYQTSTMLTGSMSPGINPGDVVVTAPVPVSTLKVGDIITYSIPVEDHRVETHRVVEILHNGDGTTAVRTKGDANNGADPWTATLQGTTAYRHVLTIPHLGTIIRTLRQPVAHSALMYGAPGVLVVGMLLTIWRRSPAEGRA